MLKVLYNIVIQIRNWLYDHKIFNIYKSSIPIISVGNITLGGTGKTPFVIYLASFFLNKNLNPLIISRGYKRKSTNQILFNNNSSFTSDLVGDEPFLISKKLPDVDIIVNKNRVQAVKYAESSTKNYDIIILDDGFQHRSIYRDLDIVLINTNQNHSSLFPSGMLREPFKNISRSDCVVLTKNNKNFNSLILEGFNVPVFQCEEEYSLSNNNRQGVGFCGIGNPSSFWKTLNDLSVDITEKIELKDHQKYDKQTIRVIESLLNNDKTFFTTEKDWVKLPQRFIKKYNGNFVDMKVNIENDLFLNMLEKLCPKN